MNSKTIFFLTKSLNHLTIDTWIGSVDSTIKRKHSSILFPLCFFCAIQHLIGSSSLVSDYKLGGEEGGLSLVFLFMIYRLQFTTYKKLLTVDSGLHNSDLMPLLRCGNLPVSIMLLRNRACLVGDQNLPRLTFGKLWLPKKVWLPKSKPHLWQGLARK